MAKAPAPMIALSHAKWAEIWPEAKPLMRAHHEEIGDGTTFDPDVEMFQAMEHGGMLHMVVGREVRGEGASSPLVGYIMWFLANSLVSRRVLVATMGPWYAVPERPGVGARLLRQSLLDLRRLGVAQALPHHWHRGRSERLGQLFTSMGAVPLESTYLLKLGG